MSELDTKLAALRDDLHETITPPDLGYVAGRARQRSTRRRMQIGAVAAVVAVSVAVPLLRSLPSEQAPTGSSLPDSLTFQVDFADPAHGYALGIDCPTAEAPCTLTLFATTDGGATWARRTLPDDDKRYLGSDAFVQDANRLTVSRVAGDEQWTMVVSDDGGRTWHTSEGGELAAPSPLPVDAGIQSVCVSDEPTSSACHLGLGALSGDGERLVPAPSQPPLIDPVIGTSATTGGRFWAAGVERTTGHWALSVSSDGGVTWSTTPVSLPGDPAFTDAWAMVEADGVLYATLQGSIAKGPYGLLAVFRSTDGGVTWTNTWRATAKTVLQAMLGSPVATADGRLLVYTTITGTYETRDGRRFTPSRARIPGEVRWTRGGYVAQRGAHTYAISRDGITWRDFTIG